MTLPALALTCISCSFNPCSCLLRSWILLKLYVLKNYQVFRLLTNFFCFLFEWCNYRDCTLESLCFENTVNVLHVDIGVGCHGSTVKCLFIYTSLYFSWLINLFIITITICKMLQTPLLKQTHKYKIYKNVHRSFNPLTPYLIHTVFFVRF